MRFDQQIARIASRSEMHGKIDEMPDDAHAMLIIWYADGRKTWAQMGMETIGQLSHILGGFLHDVFSGHWSAHEDDACDS